MESYTNEHTEKIARALDSFTTKTDIVVQWSDMDSAQHVNNTVYLRWAETARIDLFYQLQIGRGDASHSNPGRKIGMILGWQECKYIFPVTFPDTVTLGVRVTDVGIDRFMLECHTYSQRHGRLATISQQRIVSYDYQTLSKVELPEEWRQRLMACLT